MYINFNIEITDEDIDDIMSSALEGGINFWCNKVRAKGKYLSDCASEQISRKGILLLHDAEDDAVYELTYDKLLKGIKQAIEEGHFTQYEWWNCNGLDTGNIDAEVADIIVQLALFDRVVYG
jgi:hypothetical protein